MRVFENIGIVHCPIWYNFIFYFQLCINRDRKRNARNVRYNLSWSCKSNLFPLFTCYNPFKVYPLLSMRYPFKVINRNTKKRCGICSEFTIKISERHQWRRFGVFVINFDHIWHFLLESLLLTLNRQIFADTRLAQ